MAYSSITYADKVENNGATPAGRFGADDLNEIKTVTNANGADFDGRIDLLEAGGGGINNLTSSGHVGDGTTVTFSLSFAPTTEVPQAFVVGIDGVLQSPIDAYTVSTTTDAITFSSAPPVNSEIVVSTANVLTGTDISASTIIATGSTTTRLLADRFADTVNVKDFGAIGDGVTDDTVAILAAIASQPNGGVVYFPKGVYVCTSELLITVAGITFQGEGQGYYRWHSEDPAFDVPVTALLFKGTGAKSVKTRANYRASAGDANDAPISTAINIQNNSFTLRDMTVELYCDYTDPAPTNLGDDWDVGIFHGCRQDLKIIDASVVGYWRSAAIYLDSTRGVHQAELNGYPDTEGSGSDGKSIVRVYTSGGYWGIKHQGPKPKAGLMHFGFQYKNAAKFVFSGLPSDGDTITVDNETFTYRTTPILSTEIDIGVDVATTIANTKLVWANQGERLTPYEKLTLDTESVASALVIYNKDASTVSLSETSANVAVQNLSGATATSTEAVSNVARFYDEVTGLTQDDGRNSMGGSDFVVDNCVIYSINHHSGSALTTKTGDTETDAAAGCLSIDGLGGSAVLHRQFVQNTRIDTNEPFNVKLGHCARFRLLNCTQELGAGSYSRTVTSRYNTALIQLISYDEGGSDFDGGVNYNQEYTDFYLDGYRLNLREDASIGGDVDIEGSLTVGTGTFLCDSTERVTLKTKNPNTGSVSDALYIDIDDFQVFSRLIPSADNTLPLGRNSNRWSEGYITTVRTGDGTTKWTSGSGSPEGALSAVVGSMYTRTDGGAGTTLYVKETGSSSTGWVAK